MLEALFLYLCSKPLLVMEYQGNLIFCD